MALTFDGSLTEALRRVARLRAGFIASRPKRGDHEAVLRVARLLRLGPDGARCRDVSAVGRGTPAIAPKERKHASEQRSSEYPRRLRAPHAASRARRVLSNWLRRQGQGGKRLKRQRGMYTYLLPVGQ
jgi:hypothetical protein